METYHTSYSLGDESSQMWTLNKRLEAYLSRVKALEEENELLRTEIHHLRKESKVPSVRKYHEEIMKLRDALDEGHQKVVEVEMDRDSIYQEIQHVKDLCLQEKQVQEEVKKEMSESKKLLEEERRAQTWLKERLVQLEAEMEDILRDHEEEKAAIEEEISSFSQRLDSFKVAPIAFQPINLEDYSIKLSQIWQGAVEDYKCEVSSLESSLSEAKENLKKVLDENKQSQLLLQNLERELQSLKSRKELLEDVLGKQWLEQQEEERKLQSEAEMLEKEKQDLRAQIAQVLEDRQQLMHLKMSLSLEVATYRSLLEAESTRIYSPTDYTLSSPFSDLVLEKTPLRKRQTESRKTPVARDYRLTSTKRQSAELSHTPSRPLNVRSTSLSSRASPVTKEFQKVSSVLQSQNLQYTKAAKTIPSTERKIERRPPTEDVSKKSHVETISYSQRSSKPIASNTARAETKDLPFQKVVSSHNEAVLTNTETVENGFLLPGEKEILDSQLKTDYLEEALKTVKDLHPEVREVALEDQRDSLKVEEVDLVNDKEEVAVEVVTCQRVLFEKQEVVQSVQYQNIEAVMKEDVTDQGPLEEPYTSDAKAEPLPITTTYEQETPITVESEEPQELSSHFELESLTQEPEFNGQLSSDLKPEAEIKSQEEEIIDQQIISTLKESSIQQFTDEEVIEEESQGEEKPGGQSDIKDDIVLDSVDSEEVNQEIDSTNAELNFDEVIVSQEIRMLSSEVDNNQLIDVHGELKREIEDLEDFDLKPVRSESLLEESKDSTDLVEQEEHILSESKQEMCYFEEIKESLVEESSQEHPVLEKLVKDSTDSVEQEEYILSESKQEMCYFEEIKESLVEESSQEHPEHPGLEELVNSLEDTNEISEDSANNQQLNQEEESLELNSIVQESEIFTERKTQIICVTEQIIEEFIVDNKDDVGRLDAEQPENTYLPETELKDNELESVKLGDQEPEICDVLDTDEVTQIVAEKLESEEATSQLSEATQETVEDRQDIELEEQKIKSTKQEINLGQEPEVQLSKDDEDLNDQEIVQLSNVNDDGDWSLEKSQEEIWDIKEQASAIPEVETVDSLQSSQEEQKDIDLAQKQEVIKENLDKDSLPPESKETIPSSDDVQEEPPSDEQISQSFDENADNDVNAIVEEHALNQFRELEEDVQAFAVKEDVILDELKSSEPQVVEDVPTEIDSTISLEKELVEQLPEEEPQVKQDILEEPSVANTVQENQPEEEPEEIVNETNTFEEDIHFNQPEEPVACALLGEEIVLESPVTTDGIQEPQPNYEQVSKGKVSFQDEVEEIIESTEKEILQESCEVVYTSAEYTISEDDMQPLTKVQDATDEEEPTVQHQEYEGQLLEKEANEWKSESEIIEGDQEPELDQEPLCDTKPEITSQEETTTETQEEPGHDNPEADQELELEQHVLGTESKVMLQQENTEEYSCQDTEVRETTEDPLIETEGSKYATNPEDEQEPELDQMDGTCVSVEKETSENEEDSIDSKKREADQLDLEPFSSADSTNTYEEESVLNKVTEEEIIEENCEVVSAMVENVFSEKNEVEQTEVEADKDEPVEENTEDESQAPEIKMEESIRETESDTHVSEIEIVSHSDQNPKLDQEPLSDVRESIHQHEDEYTFKDPEEQISQENVVEVTKKTEEDEQDNQDSRDTGLDLEQKNEEASFGEATEEERSQESNEAALKTAEQDIIVEHQEDIKDSKEVEEGQQTDETSTFPEEAVLHSLDSTEETPQLDEYKADEDIQAKVSLVEDHSASKVSQSEQLVQNKLEQEEFTPISSGSLTSENVSVDHNQFNDPEATIQESFDSVVSTELRLDSSVNTYNQETELDSDQWTEAEATSQQEIKVKENEVSEENYEASSTAKESEETEEVVSLRKEPEEDQNIPFSLSIIQNNLRFTSEYDAEVHPEIQESELPIEGAKASGDQVVEETSGLPNTDNEHETLYKEEDISEDKDLAENKVNDNVEKTEDVSKPLGQDSTSAMEVDNLVLEKYLEPEINEQREAHPTGPETESETILVECNIEQKLYAEKPAEASDSEGPIEKTSEIEDVQTHCNLEDENSKSDESLDTQDISIYSHRSEDFEISKDYQLEQTLPDSTPLPNLDDEFEEYAEDKVFVSDDAQNVAGSEVLPELKAEELDDSLESQSSQIAIEAEEPRQDTEVLAENTCGTLEEPSFENMQLKDKETSKAESEDSDESFNSQEEMLISSQSINKLETHVDYKLEDALSDTTPLPNLVDAIIVNDKNQDFTQSDENIEELQSDPVEINYDLKSEVEVTDTLEHSQDEKEVIEETPETNVNETSPEVMAFVHETGPEEDKRDIQESSAKESSEEVVLEKEETREDEVLLTTKLGQEASLPELHTSDEEKDTTGEISDSSFDSNSGNEREEQHSSPVNGVHENTIMQATLDLEDLIVNGHSTSEKSNIVISGIQTIVKVEEDILKTHAQDIIEESVLKFATSEGKSEGLFQSLLEKSENTRLDESSELKNTIHSVVEYVDSAEETNFAKKTLPSMIDEDLFVDKDVNQQSIKTHQEKEESWSSDE